MTAILGVDVANVGQGDVDFSRAAAAAAFGIAKASEGVGFVDPSFAHNLASMRANGVLPGAYHFLRGTSAGADQCDHFLSVVGSPAGILLALDVEPTSTDRAAGAQVLPFLRRFVARCPGRSLLVYSNRGLWAAVGGPADVTGFPVVGWHAGSADGIYTPANGTLGAIWAATTLRPSPYGGITSWPLVQFTDRAQVPGAGSTDGDVWLGTLDQMRALAGIAPAPKTTIPGGDMAMYQTPSGIFAVDAGGKRGVTMDEVHAFQASGGSVAPISDAAMALIPPAPTVVSVAAAVLGLLPDWVKAAQPPAATVDAAALEAQLAADLTPHLAPGLDPAAVAAQLAPLLHPGATVDDIKALLATLRVTAG